MNFRDRTRLKTRQAIKLGILRMPKKCSYCKLQKKLEVHHLDYTDHLNIFWLCKKCHSNWHKNNICLSVEVKLTSEDSERLHILCQKERRNLKSQIQWMIKKYIYNYETR